MQKQSAMVPFSGFYGTWHDAEFDDVLSRMFDIEGNGASYASALAARFWDTIDWQRAQCAYAIDYAAAFAHALGLKFHEFEEMKSPREYNFSTDRIFCLFDHAELCALLARADIAERLREVAADMFTSRSGFISFYSPDVDAWGDLADWDHNQTGALLRAAADVVIGGDDDTFNQSSEFDLMESARCNGAIDDYLWSNTTDGARMGNRCDRVARWLAQRGAA